MVKPAFLVLAFVNAILATGAIAGWLAGGEAGRSVDYLTATLVCIGFYACLDRLDKLAQNKP